MSDVRAFNKKLDQLLRGEAVTETSSQQEYDSLVFAYELAQAEFTDQIAPRPDLQARWRAAASQRQAPRPKPFSLNLRIAAWAGAAVLVVMLLLVYREPALASLGRLLGYTYIPQVGFVKLESARVLRTAVAQVHEGQSLTVDRGVIGERDTQIWLEFSDEARPVEGAWLETPDGTRYELQWWDYEPDVPGTTGVRMSFEALPEGVTNVTLALPEGWRIPLDWVPADESDLPPADLPVITETPTPEGDQPTPESTPVGQILTPCVLASEINVCVQATARTQDGLDILLAGQSSGALLPGGDNGMNLVDPVMKGLPVQLTDAQGKVYALSEYLPTTDMGEGRIGTTLRFQGAQGATGPFQLVLPAWYARVLLDETIVVDIGEAPSVGQVIPLDATVNVAGVVVHFSQAIVEGDGVSRMTLRLVSDPFTSQNGITPFVIEMGKPDAVQDGYGYGSGDGVLELRVELMQQSGLVTGEIGLPLIGATVFVDGPHQLSFDTPLVDATPKPTPEVIDGGEFNPLPTGEPLSMDSFNYSGRALQAGDLLVVTAGEETSTLSVGNPQQGIAVETLATLPGQVLSLYVHPDRQGVDYITGVIDAGRGNLYQQLYTLRFAEGSPNLLAGSFERLAYSFVWSFDGRWLAYMAPRSGPGESDQHEVRLVDLSCRAAGGCASRAVTSPDNLHLYGPSWSPVEQRLLVQGAPPEQPFGMSDIYSVTVDPATGDATLLNLTESPQIDDWAPQWRADGSGIIYACWAAGMQNNYYGLCQNNLTPGVDEMLVKELPFNMHSILLGSDGQTLFDRMPVMERGTLRLRTYNLMSGETRVLIEWPAVKGEFTEPSLAPNGLTLAVVEPGLTSLVAIDVQSLQATPIYTAQQGAITWNGWVR